MKIRLSCLVCKKDFLSYKSNHRKFCSYKCYWLAVKMGKYNNGFQKGHKDFGNSESHKKQARKMMNSYKEGKYCIGNQWNGKTGEKHIRYIKDRTKLKHNFKDERRSSIYVSWRNEILKRDNWECKINNEDCNGRIIAHHIYSFTTYPELRYNTNNGITLCQSHHPRRRLEEKQLIPIFTELVKSQK